MPTYPLSRMALARAALDASNLNTANVTGVSTMFGSCDSLTTIYCNDDWSKRRGG